MKTFTFFATCPLYLEELLKAELEDFNASNIQIAHGGAAFDGTLETAYRACLWSRIANRILFPLVSFDAEKPEDISRAAESFEWENHFDLRSTIAIDSTLTKTKICTPDYASLSVKDGIVDRARKQTGSRPNVNTANPDLRLHLHITLKRGGISLDLSGGGLHKRGYRVETVKAGLRENTAAAVLMRGGWPEYTEKFRQAESDIGSDSGLPLFLDPMCGSGTLVTEAALMAADIAPALHRTRFGFEKWKHHDIRLWKKLKDEAEGRAAAGLKALIRVSAKLGEALFFGRDQNPKAVAAARANIRSSALSNLLSSGVISIKRGDFFTLPAPALPGAEESFSGFIAVNPPYGERLNKNDDMLLFYRKIGEVFKKEYGGWKIAMLTGHRELSESTGLKADKLNTVYNGGLRCTLAHFRIFAETEAAREAGARHEGTAGVKSARREFLSFEELSPGAQMAFNRLKKNAKRLKKWLKSSAGEIECYRLYDADMPEYSAAVDIYPPEAVIQEYAAPKTIDPVAAAGRLRELMLAVQTYLELPESSVKLKQRKRQQGKNQYSKAEYENRSVDRRIIREHGLKFFIDTETYLDTGIFLDSRPIRSMLRDIAEGKNFLNLFCYTGTASVYAASGGAASTTSVDTSKTYLEWAEANMGLNGFRDSKKSKHSFVREDCLKWLKNTAGRWELIYLDPPTFSNSKDRKDVFDIQKDHEDLIHLTMEKLTDDGLLIFCNNFRKFGMSEQLEAEFEIIEITDKTIDPDFERKKNIHRCWQIRKK